MVKPEATVAQILLMTFGSELKTMVDHLGNYQKSGLGWDEFRKKLPAPLLTKWTEVLRQCRINGYVSPYSDGSGITFSTVLSNSTMVDKCTLCPFTLQAGNCKGKQTPKNNKLDFVPCWSENSDRPKPYTVRKHTETQQGATI